MEKTNVLFFLVFFGVLGFLVGQKKRRPGIGTALGVLFAVLSLAIIGPLLVGPLARTVILQIDRGQVHSFFVRVLTSVAVHWALWVFIAVAGSAVLGKILDGMRSKEEPGSNILPDGTPKAGTISMDIVHDGGAAKCELDGHPFTLRIVSGRVVGTDQRSDTKVYGGGYTSPVSGSTDAFGNISISGGGGRTTISSAVSVQRDIFLAGPDGQEHHIRLTGDFPTRVGQIVSALSIQADWIRGDSVCNLVVRNRTLKTDTVDMNSLLLRQKLFYSRVKSSGSLVWVIMASLLALNLLSLSNLHHWLSIVVVLLLLPLVKYTHTSVMNHKAQHAEDFCVRIMAMTGSFMGAFESKNPIGFETVP